MKHISDYEFECVEISKVNLKEEAWKEWLGNMREATKEEVESVNAYIKSISKPTGVNFDDFEEVEDGNGKT